MLKNAVIFGSAVILGSAVKLESCMLRNAVRIRKIWKSHGEIYIEIKKSHVKKCVKTKTC